MKSMTHPDLKEQSQQFSIYCSFVPNLVHYGDVWYKLWSTQNHMNHYEPHRYKYGKHPMTSPNANEGILSREEQTMTADILKYSCANEMR